MDDPANTPAWLPDISGLDGTMVNTGWIIPATVAAIWDISSGDKRLLAGRVFRSAKSPDETDDDVVITGVGSVGIASPPLVTVSILACMIRHALLLLFCYGTLKDARAFDF